MGIAPRIEKVLGKISKIKETQKHGDSEVMEINNKDVVIFREYFKDSGNAQQFLEMVELLYSMNEKLPPIHVLVPLFKLIEPLTVYNDLVKGKQKHGRPELRQIRGEDGYDYAVIIKEVFENKKDAVTHQEIAKKILETKL